MGHRAYPFEVGGPKRLTVSWDFFNSRYSIRLDDEDPVIVTGAEVREGRELTLSDGSTLLIRIADGNVVGLAVEIDRHHVRTHDETVGFAPEGDEDAAVVGRDQPVNGAIGAVLRSVVPLHIDRLAGGQLEPRLGAPGIPILQIRPGAIPAAIGKHGADIEEEEAEDEVDRYHARADREAVTLCAHRVVRAASFREDTP